MGSASRRLAELFQLLYDIEFKLPLKDLFPTLEREMDASPISTRYLLPVFQTALKRVYEEEGGKAFDHITFLQEYASKVCTIEQMLLLKWAADIWFVGFYRYAHFIQTEFLQEGALMEYRALKANEILAQGGQVPFSELVQALKHVHPDFVNFAHILAVHFIAAEHNYDSTEADELIARHVGILKTLLAEKQRNLLSFNVLSHADLWTVKLLYGLVSEDERPKLVARMKAYFGENPDIAEWCHDPVGLS